MNPIRQINRNNDGRTGGGGPGRRAGLRELARSVATTIVAESPDGRSVVFRTYCSQWPLDERPHVRPPILGPGDIHPGDVVGRNQAALATAARMYDDAEAPVKLR